MRKKKSKSKLNNFTKITLCFGDEIHKKYTNHRYHVAQYGKRISAATLKNKNASKWQRPRTCGAITLSGHLCPQMLEDHTF